MITDSQIINLPFSMQEKDLLKSLLERKKRDNNIWKDNIL